MRPPAESNLDSPHAVFAQRQHVREKTRESTRRTSKNLENPTKIDLKSTKIAPWDPPRATLGEKSRSERPLEATRVDSGTPRGGNDEGTSKARVPRASPGLPRALPGLVPGHPGGDFGGNFQCFLDVASDFPCGSLEQRVRIDFRLIFGSFAQGPTLVSTRPQRCLLNVSTFAKKRASRLEEPRKTSKILPKSTPNL